MPITAMGGVWVGGCAPRPVDWPRLRIFIKSIIDNVHQNAYSIYGLKRCSEFEAQWVNIVKMPEGVLFKK